MHRIIAAVVFGTFLGLEGVAQEPAPQEQKDKPKPAAQAQKAEEVIIEAESPLNPSSLFNAKYSGDVLDKSYIQNRLQARTLPEALEETPGIGVQKSGPGQGSPFIRGFTGFRNVMLIDGIRLNNSTFREGPNQYWSTVDAYLVDHLDVIRGPSSVLYGSDSIGGTVYAHTIEPSLDEPGTNLHSRTAGRFSYAEDSIMLRQEFSGNVDGFGWMVGATYRDFDDIIGGQHYGRMHGTGYNEYGVDAKLLQKVSDHATLALGFQHFRQNEAPRWHRTLDSRSWHGTAPGNERQDDFDQERNLYYLQYRWKSEGGLIDAMTASLSFQRQGEGENRIRNVGGVPTQELREFVVNTPAFWLQTGKKTDLGYFTFGGEVYYDKVDSSGSNQNLNTGAVTSLDRGVVADDATYLLYGVFLQDEISVGRLDITAGIRYTGAHVDANEVDPLPGAGSVAPGFDDNYSAVTGSLRFLYHLDEHWNLIAGWGMGFRTPSLDDTTSTAFVLSGSQDLPSTDLDPEHTHTYDVGVRTRYDSVEVSLFGFYTSLHDFIQRVNVGDQNGDGSVDFEKENMSKGRVYGFELSSLVRFTDEWSVFVNGGYAVGDVQQVVTQVPRTLRREPLSKVAAPMIVGGLRFEPLQTGFWIEGVVTAADHQKRLSLSDLTDTQRIPVPDGTPGYTIYTLRGGYRVSQHFLINAAFENMFSKDYRIHGSGQNEPGRGFVVSAELRF